MKKSCKMLRVSSNDLGLFIPYHSRRALSGTMSVCYVMMKIRRQNASISRLSVKVSILKYFGKDMIK